MKELINAVYELIKDYRADEDDPTVIITRRRIQHWIDQFTEGDREFILTEMKNIFEKRYCTKEDAKSFLIEKVGYLQKYYAYPTVPDFLLETTFLNLQRRNKSQPTLLRLLKEVLQENYKFDMKNCGTRLKKNYVYLDDILCTGNTLYQNISTWVKGMDDQEQTYLSQLRAGNIRLIFLYIFVHEMNYQKKVWQFRSNISENFGNYYRMVKWIDIENGLGSKLEIIMPSDINQPDTVHEYQQRIEAQVAKDCLIRVAINLFACSPNLTLSSILLDKLKSSFISIELQYLSGKYWKNSILFFVFFIE